MYNITLISSKHVELGKCNSSALSEILKSINPEVIFEELPQSYFDLYYGDSPTKYVLETIAITDFLESKKTKQILVDTIDWPFLQQLKICYKKVIEDCLNLPAQCSVLLKEAIKNKEQSAFDLGFDYLNSSKSEIDQSRIASLIFNCSVLINNKDCFEILKEWDKYTEFREDYMIENIYNFSEENQFKDAVFTLGVAHRKSIKDKIEQYQKQSRLKLNWKFYGK